MGSRHFRAALCVGAAMLAAAAAASAHAEPAPGLQSATQRAIQLQDRMDAAIAERDSLATRIAVTDERIVKQRDIVARTDRDLEAARSACDARIVAMYKCRRPDAVTLLLNARTLGDLLSRAILLSRIADADHRVVRDAREMAFEAARQEALLEDLKAQDVSLRHMQDARIDELAKMLSEQNTLVARLTEEARREVASRIAAGGASRRQKRDSSIPLGTQIDFTEAAVEGYPGVGWLVPVFRPQRYRATSRPAFTAVCSWYGGDDGFNGKGTASGMIFNDADFTCAHNTAPKYDWMTFDTYLALSRGDRRIIVLVNDHGPYQWNGSGWSPHPIRVLDLSRAAAQALGVGVSEVTVQEVYPVQ